MKQTNSLGKDGSVWEWRAQEQQQLTGGWEGGCLERARGPARKCSVLSEDHSWNRDLLGCSFWAQLPLHKTFELCYQ